MAVIALTSASGSPGVTTTTLGLAMSWPRPVLVVEADPTGGSGLLSGFFRGTREYDGGLIELAWSAIDLADALSSVVRPIEGTQVSFLAGTRSHHQAGGLRESWEPLAEALADLESSGQDVIVDAGRLGLVGSPEPLLERADLTLLLTRTNLPALAAARSWAESIRRDSTGQDHRVVVLVGEGQPYRSAEVSKVLGLPVLATIADDPDAAAVYHRGATPPSRFDSSRLARSLRAAVEATCGHVRRTRAELRVGGSLS